MSRIKTVAITRPQEDSEKLAEELQAKGYKTFIVPMLRIEPLASSIIALEKTLKEKPPQVICVTSKHAVRMLSQQTYGRTVPLCAVGNTTAEEAKKERFLNVINAGGNARKLYRHIVNTYNPAKGSVLYPRAAEVATDIASDLTSAGFEVEEIITYKAHTVESFPQEYEEALGAGSVDIIMFYSKRSADNYVRITQHKDLLSHHATCVAIAQDIGIKTALVPLGCELRSCL